MLAEEKFKKCFWNMVLSQYYRNQILSPQESGKLGDYSTNTVASDQISNTFPPMTFTFSCHCSGMITNKPASGNTNRQNPPIQQTSL